MDYWLQKIDFAEPIIVSKPKPGFVFLTFPFELTDRPEAVEMPIFSRKPFEYDPDYDYELLERGLLTNLRKALPSVGLTVSGAVLYTYRSVGRRTRKREYRFRPHRPPIRGAIDVGDYDILRAVRNELPRLPNNKPVGFVRSDTQRYISPNTQKRPGKLPQNMTLTA